MGIQRCRKLGNTLDGAETKNVWSWISPAVPGFFPGSFFYLLNFCDTLSGMTIRLS